MKDESIAKLIALKAYLLVKQADPHERGALREKAERAVHFFVGHESFESIRRRVFYNLILAELLRNTDPIPYRAAAVDDGERLSALGYSDPASIYMKIVEATTERLTTAHFGDYKSSPNWSHSNWTNSPLAELQAFQGSLAPAFAALHLEQSDVEVHASFLEATSLA
jgi:hypothetical protein